MGEEFAPGVSEAGDGSQGQAAGTAEPSGPVRLGINLDNTEEGRALKSALQRETQAERAARIEAERRAADAERRLEQIAAQQEAVLGAVRQSDPEAYELLVQKAKVSEKDTELEQLRQRVAEAEQREADARAYQEWHQNTTAWYTNQALSVGINPADPEFQAGLAQTLQDGDGAHAMSALVKVAARKQQAPEGSPVPDYVSPPSGGRPRENLKPADKEAIAGQILELSKDRTLNRAKIAELTAKLNS